MKHFAICDIKGPWAPKGSGRRRGAPDWCSDVDACRLSEGALPPGTGSCRPCGFLSRLY